MDTPGVLQRLADGTDAAVHHVRWRHEIHARLGLGQRHFDQRLHRRLVHHVAVVVDQAVLAVGGIRIERHVTDETQLRETLLQLAGGALEQTLRIPGLAGILGLHRAIHRREQGQRRDTQRHALLAQLHQLIDRQPLHPRHRRHRLAHALPLDDKGDHDQVGDGKHVLAHEGTGEGVATHAAHANGGEAHGWRPVRWRSGYFTPQPAPGAGQSVAGESRPGGRRRSPRPGRSLCPTRRSIACRPCHPGPH